MTFTAVAREPLRDVLSQSFVEDELDYHFMCSMQRAWVGVLPRIGGSYIQNRRFLFTCPRWSILHVFQPARRCHC